MRVSTGDGDERRNSLVPDFGTWLGRRSVIGDYWAVRRAGRMAGKTAGPGSWPDTVLVIGESEQDGYELVKVTGPRLSGHARVYSRVRPARGQRAESEKDPSFSMARGLVVEW